MVGNAALRFGGEMARRVLQLQLGRTFASAIVVAIAVDQKLELGDEARVVDHS